MSEPSAPRKWRPKAWTWLEPESRPDLPHITLAPNEVVLARGRDGEGRFVVLREHEGGAQSAWVGDRRHWTEVPPASKE
ncbi:MAG TPA: hypothetical protein VFZ61_08600 [Polyangiales bacterium]